MLATPLWAQSKPSTEIPMLQVGFGQVEITPIRPTPMAGYYGKRLSTETHDPLWAKATVLDDGQISIVIISLDLVAMPGEIFVQLGLAIKDGSPFATTTINELANGSIGYVPTRQAYAQGNYEVVSAHCAEGCGEMLVDAALTQLRTHFEIQNKK